MRFTSPKDCFSYVFQEDTQKEPNSKGRKEEGSLLPDLGLQLLPPLSRIAYATLISNLSSPQGFLGVYPLLINLVKAAVPVTLLQTLMSRMAIFLCFEVLVQWQHLIL